MTTITLEGKEYQLDIEQAKKLNLLKEKDNRVRSWEEFKEKYNTKYGFVYNRQEGKPEKRLYPISTNEQLLPHEAKAIQAFSKLLKLRRDWIGEWEPQCNTKNYYIFYNQRHESFLIDWLFEHNHSLSFPTNNMAKDFLETFHDLIEEAKILI